MTLLYWPSLYPYIMFHWVTRTLKPCMFDLQNDQGSISLKHNLDYIVNSLITHSIYHTDKLVPSIPVHIHSVDIDLILDRSQRNSVVALYSFLYSGMSFHFHKNNNHLKVIKRILNIFKEILMLYRYTEYTLNNEAKCCKNLCFKLLDWKVENCELTLLR